MRLSRISMLMAACVTLFLIALPQLYAEVLTVPDEYATIDAAAEAAIPGDLIIVKAGRYDYYSGYTNKEYAILLKEGVDLVGEGPDRVIITATAASYYQHGGILAMGNNIIEGISVSAESFAIKMIQSTQPITIKNCLVIASEYPYAGQACNINGKNILLENNIFNGKSLVTGSGSLVHSVFYREDPATPVAEAAIVTGAFTIRNNVFYCDNKGMEQMIGLLLTPTTSSTTLLNNIFWANGEQSSYYTSYDLVLESNSTTKRTVSIDYCDIVTNSIKTNARISLNVLSHTIYADPLFNNVAENDFRLIPVDQYNTTSSAISPCIDAGSPLYLDADETVSDIGAYGGYYKI